MKKALSYLFVAILALMAGTAFAQTSKNEKADQEESIRSTIDAKRFIFKPQSVSPMRGGTRQLSPGYTLTVLPDTVISDLPFFGRAYQASPGVSEGGVKFTSTDFQYTVKNRKKGGWDIGIKPVDVGNSPQVFISVSINGSASVRISSTDRESISYNGFIEKIEPK